MVREWRAIKKEILRHKWIESQKRGEDIGWERAFMNWMLNHSRDFLALRGTQDMRDGIFFEQLGKTFHRRKA
jgi:hypothetical protein